MDSARPGIHVADLYSQRPFTRRIIILSFWLVIVFAVPLWWTATSIQRLPLPSASVLAESDKQLEFTVTLNIDNSLAQRDATILSDLKEGLESRIGREYTRWNGIQIGLDQGFVPEDSSNVYSLKAGADGMVVTGRTLSVGNVPLDEVADALASLIVPHSISDQAYDAVQYSPRYRLAFTLMNEDAANGHVILGWDIKQAIAGHIRPITSALHILHNFTIESQVQFHGPLAFETRSLGDGTFGLTREDLTVFVNSAEWTLSSSVSNDPVLHFIIFVPSPPQRPLFILNDDGTPSSSNAFLLPQWGGVLIYNPPAGSTGQSSLSSSDLRPMFSSFAAQLRTLLGVPLLPAGVSVNDNSGVLTDWQLDALFRQRALENAHGARDTLLSTVKLVDQIENMPVDKFVQKDVQDALAYLKRMNDVASLSLTETLTYSAQAVTLASRAFFHPGMLALLYFPAEHKYAVYTPLFASAIIPLVAAAIRELRAWNTQRRATSKIKTA